METTEDQAVTKHDVHVDIVKVFAMFANGFTSGRVDDGGEGPKRGRERASVDERGVEGHRSEMTLVPKLSTTKNPVKLEGIEACSGFTIGGDISWTDDGKIGRGIMEVSHDGFGEWQQGVCNEFILRNKIRSVGLRLWRLGLGQVDGVVINIIVEVGQWQCLFCRGRIVVEDGVLVRDDEHCHFLAGSRRTRIRVVQAVAWRSANVLVADDIVD